MSSPSTKPTEGCCPECGGGPLLFDIVSKTFDVKGRCVEVEGLMPYRCSSCSVLVWPADELKRAQEAIAVKLRKLAA